MAYRALVGLMEILFVTHKYPPSTGGMEKQSYELVEGMRKYAKVHLLMPRKGESKLLFFIALRRRIIDLCRTNPRISVVHFNDALIAAVCVGHKGYTHLRRAVTVHGLDIVFPNQWYQRTILPKFNRFDLIIAVSAATADACITRGLDKSKVVVVPNGVDHDIADLAFKPSDLPILFEKYKIQPDKPILVAMGRSVRRKGFSWFIEQVMPAMKHPTQLLLIGPFSPMPSHTERLLHWLPSRLRAQLELALGFPTDEVRLRSLLLQNPNVKHLGRIPFEDVVQLFRAAHAFVMPNIKVSGDMEGFGLVCLEASICGIPVLATNIDGIPTAIHHQKNGILLPSADADAWSMALDHLIDDFPVFKQRAATWQSYTIEHFGWEQMVQNYLEHFTKLLPAQ